jgi:serine/threonine-protein kinase
MSDNRWQRVEEIFHRAVELAPEARVAFLNQACAADRSLRREVELLLAHESEDDTTFAGPAGDDLPRTIAHYRILAKLGEGGMGAVYRATDTKLGRDVAIKLLPADFAEDAGRMARFTREAKVLASLNHPNIASIYGVEDRAIVMELVEGRELRGPLPIKEAIPIARQIADALEAAHEKGIVHRDLKPANVKIRPDGTVKVLDFGLAKIVESSDASPRTENSPTLTLDTVTRVGVILGTAEYMAPEQAQGKPATQQADIWTFGVVLYEMITGKRLFKGDTISDTLAAILAKEPDWSALPAATPLRIRKLLRRCLERDLRQRLQAIGEARIAIDAPEQEAQQAPAAARLGPWAVATLTMAFAITAAIGWWRGTRSAPLHPLIRLSVELAPEVKPDTSIGGAYLALSPDGTLLAVTARGADGEIRVATRRLDQTRFTPLAGTEGADSPFFSPDGQWIAFNSDRKIKKISVGGGAAVTLCDAPGGITASWGDDGNIIAPLGWETGLSRISSAGGAPAPVTELNHEKGERRHGWPQVLPGSRAVLFTTLHSGRTFDDGDIEVVSLQTGRRSTLHHGGFFARYLPSGHLVWIYQNTLYTALFDIDRLALTGDPRPIVEDIDNGEDTGGDFAFSQTGVLVYVSRLAAPQRSIFWLDSTNRIRPLHSAPGLYDFPRFSPDGQRLAFSARDGQGHEDIWVRNLDRNTASRVTLLPGQNEWPVWTPDGKSLVFWSSNPAAPGIYSVRSDGSGVAQRLTDGKNAQLPESISPDGKRLALRQTSAGGGVEIWTAPLEGDTGHPRLGRAEPFLQKPFNTIHPAFSPDGRWLAYDTSEPGKQGLWVVPFPGPGGGWLISSHGSQPIWSRNGRELFFLADLHTITVADYIARGDAWRLAICAIKLAEQIPLDFFFQVFYPTSGGF